MLSTTRRTIRFGFVLGLTLGGAVLLACSSSDDSGTGTNSGAGTGNGDGTGGGNGSGTGTGNGSGTGTGDGGGGGNKDSGQTAEDAGSDSASEAGSGKKANGEDCSAPTDCESGVCFIGGGQSYCTLECTTENAATVCVAPLTGKCNNKGYCKRD